MADSPLVAANGHTQFVPVVSAYEVETEVVVCYLGVSVAPGDELLPDLIQSTWTENHSPLIPVTHAR